MKVIYSFRTEKHALPEPKILFENVRRLHIEFKRNPSLFFRKYEEWLRPMNQLRNGHFFSLNWDSKEFKFTDEYVEESDLKLEMEFLDHNFVRISFQTENFIPYRVDTGINKNTNMENTIKPIFRVYLQLESKTYRMKVSNLLLLK